MIDPQTVEQYDLPGHLEAVPDEIDAVNLPVTGALPPELDGRYLRNGPNPCPAGAAATCRRATACCTAYG
ncbi:hypothetical protein ACFQQB_65345 [Nonomuraea rubra]|uniref:hypothetical protein n=1 Tax=Nonomuraea rubra TaxID=46180 RepID=UPI00361AE7A6